MKVNVLARPDHSLNLFKDLEKVFKNDSSLINLYTFYALRDGSISSKLFSKLKKAPSNAITLDLYTFTSRLVTIFSKRFGLNFRKSEVVLLDLLAPWSEIANCDLLHYWPFYCADHVKKIKNEGNIKTVAEYYEAEPSFVNEIYRLAYDKYGIKIDNPINLMIDQNKCFDFETNFIVASEFTKQSYARIFPDANFHVCSYGPAGYQLIRKPIKNNYKKLKIIYVGQVCLEKGVDVLIAAAKEQNVIVDLVGPVRSGQENIFKEILLGAKNINIIGSMRHCDVLNLYQNYDLLCLPSLADNYSLAVVEALSRAIPVIVTQNCGNAQDIINFNLGNVCNAGSVISLSEAIESFQNDFDWCKFEHGLSVFFSDDSLLSYPKSVYETYKMIMNE